MLFRSLAEAGCAEGDEVHILGFAFTYEGDGKEGGRREKRADTTQPAVAGALAPTDLDGKGTLCHGEEHDAHG